MTIWKAPHPRRCDWFATKRIDSWHVTFIGGNGGITCSTKEEAIKKAISMANSYARDDAWFLHEDGRWERVFRQRPPKPDERLQTWLYRKFGREAEPV